MGVHRASASASSAHHQQHQRISSISSITASSTSAFQQHQRISSISFSAHTYGSTGEQRCITQEVPASLKKTRTSDSDSVACDACWDLYPGTIKLEQRWSAASLDWTRCSTIQLEKFGMGAGLDWRCVQIEVKEKLGVTWNKNPEWEPGRRTWNENLEGESGIRTWNENLEWEPGMRTWNENLEVNSPKLFNHWNDDLLPTNWLLVAPPPPLNNQKFSFGHQLHSFINSIVGGNCFLAQTPCCHVRSTYLCNISNLYVE